MPTQTSNAVAGHVHLLRFARESTKKLLAGIPADKLCAQPGPCVNHALWIGGHLASSDDYFQKEFGGGTSALPESWNTLFGMGSKPVSDPSKYPSWAEVTHAMDDRHASWVKFFESVSPEKLEQATPEGWRAYAPTLGDVAPFAAWHEGYHGGQLSALRKAFGLQSAFG